MLKILQLRNNMDAVDATTRPEVNHDKFVLELVVQSQRHAILSIQPIQLILNSRLIVRNEELPRFLLVFLSSFYNLLLATLKQPVLYLEVLLRGVKSLSESLAKIRA